MTKVEAIKKIIENFGGIANWQVIYNNIEKYYPEAKKSQHWKSGVRGVLYRGLKDNKYFKKIKEGAFVLKEYNENKLYIKDFKYKKTDKDIISKIRIGQGRFRKILLKTFKKFPITEIDEKEILVASHIKPWEFSNDEERLNVNNGFILSATIDKLFDKGFITFTEDKKLLISTKLSKENIKRIGISENQIYDNLPVKNREKFLNFHYQNIFLKF